MGYTIRILNRVKDRKTTIKTYLCGVIFQEQPKSVQEYGNCRVLSFLANTEPDLVFNTRAGARGLIRDIKEFRKFENTVLPWGRVGFRPYKFRIEKTTATPTPDINLKRAGGAVWDEGVRKVYAYKKYMQGDCTC